MTKRIPLDTHIQSSIAHSHIRFCGVKSWHLFSNVEGRAAYWVIAGLLLLTIFSGAVVLYRTGGVADKQLRSIIALDRKIASVPPQRYKIAMQAAPSETAGAGIPSDTLASETPGDGSAISSGKDGDNQPLTGPADTIDRQDEIPPPQTGREPVERVEKKGATATRGHADPELQTEAVTTKNGKESSQETETACPPAEAGAGKRFFVQVDVGNVREGPSMASGIKFRVKHGCSLTVTDKRGGWDAIKTDDGRCGWVYHTLLADSLVPRRDGIILTVGKVEAIRPEVPVDNVARVVFELNGPYPPEVMMIKEGMPRVVCDFLHVSPAPGIGSRIEVKNGIIEKIRIGLHKWPQFRTRVVLDLVPEQNYKLEKAFLGKENRYVLVVKME